MGKKAIRWLYRELPKLVTQGILTAKTADKLRRHYGEVKGSNRKIALFIIFGTLGALLIGLGIILLIGHNWEQLQRFIRTILSIALLAIGQAFAFWVLLKRPESQTLKESSATFLSLMVGASIALVCQTYNIPGDAGTFTLTWMLLILPLIYLMQASLPAAIYLIGITLWSSSYWNNPAMAFLFWPLAALVVPHLIWILRRDIYTIRTTILSLVMAICLTFGTGLNLERVWPGFWVITYSSIFTIFYSLGYLSFKNITLNWQKPLRLLGAMGIIILAFRFTLRSALQSIYYNYYALRQEPFSLSLLPTAMIAVTITAIAILLFYDNIRRKNLMASLFTALPLLSLAGYLLKGGLAVLPLVIFNLYLLVLGISSVVIGNRNNSFGAINTGMLILAILITVRFFDSDINFILKGLTFIAVGIGFLATNTMLIRRKGGRQ